MSPYPINSGSHWQLPNKRNNHTNFPGPIYNIPENPVPESIAEKSGDKVEALETLETTVQVELNKRNIYLTQVSGNYNLEYNPHFVPYFAPLVALVPRVYPWNFRQGVPSPLKEPTIPQEIEVPSSPESVFTSLEVAIKIEEQDPTDFLEFISSQQELSEIYPNQQYSSRTTQYFDLYENKIIL